MLKLLPASLFLLSLLICTGVHASPLSPPAGEDTIRKIVVSDSTWLTSSGVDYSSCQQFPWGGASFLPADSTYTSLVTVGQPNGYPAINELPEADVLRARSGVRFFKTYLSLATLAVVTDCRFRIYVDDDVEIYINKVLIAREGTGIPANYKGEPHDLMIYNFGPHYNPFTVNSDAFDYVNDINTVDIFQPGENEVVLAVRNKLNDMGGVIFRMDYSYVINPEWISLQEEEYLDFELFPNPTTGSLTLKSRPFGKSADLKIFAADGQQVYDQRGIERNEVELDISAYKAGIYMVQLSNGKNICTRRIHKL